MWYASIFLFLYFNHLVFVEPVFNKKITEKGNEKNDNSTVAKLCYIHLNIIEPGREELSMNKSNSGMP